MKTFFYFMAGMVFAVGVNAAELGRSQPVVRNDFRDTGVRASGNKATGLQLSLFNPAQIFPEKYDVYGLRLNILYGLNQNLRGFDCGVVNVGAGRMDGFQLGVANSVDDLAGLQIGAYNAIAISTDGSVQIGALNQAFDANGLQLGAVNYSKNARGVQIGAINICETIDGVQIGLINIISQSETLVFCPIFNAQF